MTSEQSGTATVTVRDHREADRFEAVDAEGTVAGFAEYRRYDDRIVFTHTEVDEAFEGRGIGSTLVREALDAVRGDGLRVVPQCPFVKAWIARHPDYADLTR
jgi:predicted GNAT family acetyltransferase